MSREHGPGVERCTAIFARLSEYLDEELDPAVCAGVDEHMDGCAPCRAYLESLRRTVAALRDIDSPRMPDELRRQVLEAYHALRDSRKG
jgi:RNA polymerase sigma-70 factor (ECF subfamily)